MDHQQQRGRSPSAGHQSLNRHTPSPSPNGAFRNANNNGLGVEQQPVAFDNPYNNFVANQASFDTNSNLFPSGQSFSQAPNYSQAGLYQDQSLPQGLTTSAPFDPQGNNLYSDFGNLGDTSGLNGGFDPPLFTDTGPTSTGSLFGSSAVDPQLLGTSSQHSTMSTQAQSPTPPHLLAPSMLRQASGSPHNSPGLQQGAFQPPPVPSPRMQHSRHTSLDPSSAAYPHHSGEWAFAAHRRQPSDAHSEISNSSAHPSPYLTTLDSLDHQDHHSPLLNAQQDPAVYNDVMAIGDFSISGGPQQNPYISPAHSPAISPRLLPQQQQLPSFTTDSFGIIGASSYNQYNGQQPIFQPQGQESFPELNQGHPDFQGHNEAMSPPEINIQLAPPSRQASFEPARPDGSPEGALSPPDRSRSRNRTRAKSDSSVRGSSVKIEKDMLSPSAAGVGSRSPSPSGNGKSRRSSTSSVPNRDYILDLADPSRPASNASGESNASKRTQKHPATFQCSLCPKRFTRAYNLRSHLRTHTDERPFVCNHCGKAFARQHDRKRHEGLHSGEKKFVCRGQLKDGNNWGCGRRFARADALGRHFRSEAGRICIKPLLEEEALERQNNQNQQAGLQQFTGQVIPGQSILQQSQPSYDAYGNVVQTGYDPSLQMGAYRLPNALLQQYPTLGNIWDTLPSNAPEDLDGDISGRNSFDGSSAGEYEDDGDYSHPQSGWASDVGPSGSYT